MNYNKQTPILIIVSTQIRNISLLINRMKQIEPQRLYFAYDYIKSSEEDDCCKQIQELTATFHWHCKIKTLYNKKYLGYEPTLRKALRWFFRYETEGIILSGRSIPSLGALTFCSVLLEKYRYDERIGHIAGWNFLDRVPIQSDASYYFSKLININGCWGSWQRVWKDFDTQLKTFPVFKKKRMSDHIPTHKLTGFHWFCCNYLNKLLEAQYEYINLINNRLTIVPNIDNDQIFNDIYEWDAIKHPLIITNNNTYDLKYQEIRYFLPAITKNVPDGMLYLKKQLLNAVNYRMKIPKIIHQIYEDPAGPPQKLLTLASTWREKHPEWEYRFWNRAMIHDFLKTRCPDFLPYYHSYLFDVQRWDAIRYLILYHIGGLYVDLDYECLEPLDVLLNGQTCCMGMEPTVNSRISSKPLLIGNALMASKPNHPYMAAIVEDMKTNFSIDYRKGDSTQIMETTGPSMVSRVYEQFKRKRDITLLSADLVTPLTMREVWMLQSSYNAAELEEKIEKAFAVHYFWGSWSPQTSEGKVMQIISE